MTLCIFTFTSYTQTHLQISVYVKIQIANPVVDLKSKNYYLKDLSILLGNEYWLIHTMRYIFE